MKNQKIKILIVPAGSANSIALIKYFNSKKNIETFTADIDPLATGLFLAYRGLIAPKFKSKKFFPKLLELVSKERIDLAIPCLDGILLPFSEKKDEFERKGCQVIVSNVATLRITRDKYLAYLKLKNKLPFPKTFKLIEEINIKPPLFIKPRFGEGSINAHKINNKEELEFYYRRVSRPIIQEFLPGEEYTVDCFTNKNGRLITAIPRIRLEIKSGISTKSKIVNETKLVEIAEKLSKLIKLKGFFFFQTKKDRKNRHRVIEINPRVGGTMIYSNFAAGDLFMAVIENYLYKKKIKKPDRIKKVTMCRYWNEIYVDNK